MRASVRIILLIGLLAGFACVEFLSSAQQLSPGKGSSSSNEDLPLFLNGQPIGSMSNTQKLETQFRLLTAKLPSANMPDGSIPNIGREILIPDDRLSMASVGQLWTKISEYFDFPGERFGVVAGPPCDADSRSLAAGPTFILSNSPLTMADMDKVKGSENCLLSTQVWPPDPNNTNQTRFVKAFRTAVSSLEISDTGAYQLNEQVKDPKLRVSPVANLGSPAFRRNLELAQVTHRPIDPSSLEKEIDAWIKRRIAEGPTYDDPSEANKAVELPVVVSSRTSYGSLAQVLKFLGKKNVKLTIVINNDSPSGPVRQK